MTDVFDMVREANPIKDVDRYADFVGGTDALLPGTRRDPMAKYEPTETRITNLKARRQPRWRWVAAALVAVVAVAVGAGMFLATRGGGEEDVVVDASPDPTQVAELWLDRWAAGDPTGYEALMSPDATAVCTFCEGWAPEAFFEGVHDFSSIEGRRSRLLYAWGGSLTYSCSAAGEMVVCESEQTSPFDPEPGVIADRSLFRTYQFTVQGGVVTRFEVSSDAAFGGFDPGLIGDYGRWLAANYPDAHEELFFLTTMLVNDQSQIDAHREYVAEWAGAG